MICHIGFAIFAVLFSVCFSSIQSYSTSSGNTMEQFLDKLLDTSVYDRRIRPFFKNNKPTVVKMNMNINTISGISEVNMV
jgi:hypothetical protein